MKVKLPQKNEVLSNKVEDKVAYEPQQVCFRRRQQKSLSLEVKNGDRKDDASVFPPSEAPDQTKIAPGKVPLVFYPFEFDEVSLTWRRSQRHLLRPEDWSSFLNFESPTVDSIILKSKLFYKLREEAFKVNSRTSYFQVRVTDIGRIRELIGFWKRRKRPRKKNKIGHRNHGRKSRDLRRGLTRAPSRARSLTISRSG